MLLIGLLQFPDRMSEKSQKENSAGVSRLKTTNC